MKLCLISETLQCSNDQNQYQILVIFNTEQALDVKSCGNTPSRKAHIHPLQQ